MAPYSEDEMLSPAFFLHGSIEIQVGCAQFGYELLEGDKKT